MRIPVWLTLGVAGLVLVFGAYRIWLALRKEDAPTEGDDPAPQRRGIYNMSRRSHLFVGIIYLLLGGALVATSFGFNPFGGLFGPGTEEPDKDKAPTKDGVPRDGFDKDKVREEYEREHKRPDRDGDRDRPRKPDRDGDRPAGSAAGSSAAGSSAAGSADGSSAGSAAGGSSAGGSNK